MIRPTKFNDDGTVEVVHDEAGHGGTATAAHVAFATALDGTPDPRALVLTCPVAGCGWASLHHPLGDGTARREIQRLYLRFVRARAVALGIPVAERTIPEIKKRLRRYVRELLGGADETPFWQIEDVDQA